MKGKVNKINNKLQLILKPENNQEKKWLFNAFYCISPGVLSSDEGVIQELVLWTDNTRKLPRKRDLSIVPEKKTGEP